MTVQRLDVRSATVNEPAQPIKSAAAPQLEARKESSLPPAASEKTLPDFRIDLRKFDLTQIFNRQAPVAENKIGELKEGELIPTAISANDTQTDVLRTAYREYAKRAGLSDADAYVNLMVKDADQILHPKTNQPYTADEFQAQRDAGSINMIPQNGDVANARQAKVQELLSYSAFDWSVTGEEEKQIVDILKNDPNLSQTVKGLNDNDFLNALISRVDEPENRRELIDLLGKKLDQETSGLVEPEVEKLDLTPSRYDTTVKDELWQVRFNLAKLGVSPSNTAFDRTSYSDLIATDLSAPFSGVGATGSNPINGSIGLGDQFDLLTGDKETTASYSNPIPNSLTAYLSTVSPQDRVRQAQLLLNQPISTTMPEIYGDKLPSRADVIRVAAAKYNLDPRMVAGIILAEQRDQSSREDAKDYTAATNAIKQANTSIGLGQVVVSTAKKGDLFSDLIGANTNKHLTHNNRARLLADDTVNIFAVAKYIRSVADKAESAPSAVQARFPNADFSKFKEHSSNWSRANVEALGSEYTSSAWDVANPQKRPPFVDSPFWGNFVGEAYQDAAASKIF